MDALKRCAELLERGSIHGGDLRCHVRADDPVVGVREGCDDALIHLCVLQGLDGRVLRELGDAILRRPSWSNA
eukprot:8646435-Alexandrium_andersonii.AAC.1